MTLDEIVEKAWQTREVEPEQSMSLLDQLESEQNLDAIECAQVLIVRSFHHGKVHQFKQLLDAGFRALELLGNHSEPQWHSRLHGRLAIGFHSLGDLPIASRHFQLQVSLAEDCTGEHRLEELFLGNHNLAKQYYRIGDFERAGALYQQCYTYLPVDSYQRGYLLLNHAQVHIKTGNWSDARSCAGKAYEIGVERGVERICVYVLPVLAELACEDNNFDEAEALLLNGVRTALNASLPSYQVRLKLATLYRKRSRYDEAELQLQLAEPTIDRASEKMAIAELRCLQSDLYEELGRYQLALKYHKEYFELKNEVFSVQIDDRAHARSMARRIDELEREQARLRRVNRQLQRSVTHFSELHDQARELSEKDTLTALFNRRYLLERAKQLLAEATLRSENVTLAIADIDHFKSINDCYGHSIGDEVLKCLADIMRNSMRSVDIISRYGGEEFVILMPDTSIVNAASALERLRSRVRNYQWHALRPDLQVTLSCGVASMSAPCTFDDLFCQADQRLYIAKRRGRDRIVADESARETTV